MIVNVALTGAVPSKQDSPFLPVSPEEIAADAIECGKAGAAIVHIHVRDEGGLPVHRRDLFERAIAPIRAELPELIICVTTSGRVDPSVGGRMVGLDLDPSVRPDMASLTLGSFNFPTTVSINPPSLVEDLLRRMIEQGIKPELEVFELGMVNTAHILIEKDLIASPAYFNILLGSLGAAPAFVGHLAAIVDRLPADAEWAAAGIGAFQRPMVVAAAVMGGNVRTGMEDSPRHAGKPVSNLEAVTFARNAAELVGRPLATPSEARQRLDLPSRPCN